MTNSELISAKVPAISVEVRRQAVVLSLVVLAVALRILAISQNSLNGDEYTSLADAKVLGQNWNSIIYSALMHFWIRLGDSELWLRLPAVVFGALTVPVFFKIGEKLFGWRTGLVAALLAATSPFNIYHSQEVRFYSLFIFASASFMLATLYFADSKLSIRKVATVLLSGLVLVFSQFLGLVALYPQGAATVFAMKSRGPRRLLLSAVFGLPILLFGLPLIPAVHRELWHLYVVYGNAPSSAEPVITPVSAMTIGKVLFTGYVFVFGYHMYPLRFVVVAAGVCLTAILLVKGTIKLYKQSRWRMLPFAYLLTLLGIYVVLDSIGGRVAAGVSPRHVAFVWPCFLILLAIGLASFTRPFFEILLVAALAINGLSILGKQGGWTYGAKVDYRTAAEFASKWATADTAILHDGRSQGPIDFYFKKGTPLIGSWNYLNDRNLSDLLRYERLIFVSDDWEPFRRPGFDQLMQRLAGGFMTVDGRVDYPLFEYVLERKPGLESAGYSLRPDTNQLFQPLSIYGLEFQDLHLPVSVRAKDVSFQVIGAYGLPGLDAHDTVAIPLSQPVLAKRLVLLTDVVGLNRAQPGQPIAEVVVAGKNGTIGTFPLRLDKETASWDAQCQPAADCQTVYRWHKRMAIVGQNSFSGAWRDFQAGLHGVAFDLPREPEVTGITIRYLEHSGHLYVWGIALPNN